jgi:DNA-binding MurR/RpiR family transcriptional regulator
MVRSLDIQIAGLADAATIERLVEAAGSLAGARNVYCLGLRSSHAAAWHIHYVLSLIGRRSILLDGFAGVGMDPMANAGRRDVLFAASVMPYTRATVEAAEHAKSAGLAIIAVTDSEVAPLAQIADHAVFVPTTSPSFFHTMTPAFAVAEILTALVAGMLGKSAIEALHRTDAHQRLFNVHISPRAAKR